MTIRFACFANFFSRVLTIIVIFPDKLQVLVILNECLNSRDLQPRGKSVPLHFIAASHCCREIEIIHSQRPHDHKLHKSRDSRPRSVSDAFSDVIPACRTLNRPEHASFFKLRKSSNTIIVILKRRARRQTRVARDEEEDTEQHGNPCLPFPVERDENEKDILSKDGRTFRIECFRPWPRDVGTTRRFLVFRE